jgi:4-amino-4-deoxy-L-arabinose transferase-like glycosyltransferase
MNRYFLLLFFSLLTLFRFYFSAHFNLTPDETYYWFWSEHLHLSYFDHPPMVAWLIKLSTAIFGQKEWAVRLPGMLMGIGDTVLIYLLGKKVFKSREAGITSAVVLNSILIFSVGMVIITPDTPQLFFWIAAIYFSYNAAIEKRKNDWFLTGIALGLGLLSKYTMILFLPAIFLFLLLTPSCREDLYSWKPWASLLIAFLIFSPVIIWNEQNHWISFLFQLRHGTSSRDSPGARYFFEFLGGQAAVFSPFIFIGLIWSLWKAYKIGRKRNLYQFSFLFWMAFPLFLFFTYESLHTKVEANWPVFSQTGSIILLGGFFYQKFRDRRDSFLIKFWIIFSIGFGFLLMMMVHIQAFTKFIPLKAEVDRTNDLIGWSEMKQIYLMYPEAEKWPVLTTSHTMVGETAFYLKNGRAYQWGAPHRITDLSHVNPESIEENGSFLLVTFDDDRFSNEAASLFKNLIPLADIPVFAPRGDSTIQIRSYHFFKGENFKGFPFLYSILESQ